MVTTDAAASSSPPLLLLHASGMSSAQFARLRRVASEAGYDVSAPDLLGVGATPPVSSYSLAAEVDAVVEQLRRQAAPSHVFGHSFGGLVALEAALRIPDRVASLCVYEPVIVVLAGRQGSARARAEVAAIDDLMQLPVDDGGRVWVERFIDWWNGPGFFAGLPGPAQAPHLASALASHRQAGVVRDATVTVENLAALAVPTLFLTGETSPTSARESAGIAAAAMPNARVEVIPGAGHMGPLTHGPAVNAATLAFFEQWRA